MIQWVEPFVRVFPFNHGRSQLPSLMIVAGEKQKLQMYVHIYLHMFYVQIHPQICMIIYFAYMRRCICNVLCLCRSYAHIRTCWMICRNNQHIWMGLDHQPDPSWWKICLTTMRITTKSLDAQTNQLQFQQMSSSKLLQVILPGFHHWWSLIVI